ncbi:MAG TPA: DUF58 domain-containing protein [Gaiellaceae bacterium]|jgi:uncharacterized protein (DUF58 family)|nr:DUF58 domain-containing protein [Gaiellaceae bacterium]
MTRRGRAVLALGVGVYLAAWVFGSRALYPVATGLVFTVLLSLLWVRLSSRPPHVRRHGAARDVVEGDDVRVDLVVESTGAVAPPTLVAHERPGRLDERRVELARVGASRFAGGYELRAVPRGRYAFQTVRLTIEDPFGLAHAELVQGEPQALVVYPRLVDLDRLFSEGGAHAQDGRRLLLRRPTGFELHSVREYVEGESLRKVHWPSTARRARLMVRELEDAPRDEVAVLLDGDARAGSDPAFDVAVRAAGSVLQSHVRRNRRCALVFNSAARDVQQVGSEADWRRALELLAAAKRDAPTAAFALLQADGGVAARSLELVVVTSRVDAPLADRLVQRALSRRGTSLVYVEAEQAPEPQLLRLQSVGIPVAVVRPGEDLAAALSAQEVLVA